MGGQTSRYSWGLVAQTLGWGPRSPGEPCPCHRGPAWGSHFNFLNLSASAELTASCLGLELGSALWLPSPALTGSRTISSRGLTGDGACTSAI